MVYENKYETTVDAKGNWAICEKNGGDVVADLMTKENAVKICAALNMWESTDAFLTELNGSNLEWFKNDENVNWYKEN